MTAHVRIRAGRDKSLRRHHPWIFSGAIDTVGGAPGSGETVAVLFSDGTPAGYGAISPHSQIAVRMWNYLPAEKVDERLFHRRLERCIGSRGGLMTAEVEPYAAFRLVNAESDGLPGLIVDRYGPFMVCQFLSCGVERWKGAIVEALQALIPAAGIYERSEVAVRRKEGLPLRSGPLKGEEPPPLVEIREGVCRYAVDLRLGHKTGFYLDQRDSRSAVQKLANSREVLNVFAYTGGFGVAALHGGARRVTNLEASAEALTLAQHNFTLNGFSHQRAEYLRGDAFTLLRRLGETKSRFDLVVLDPPKFAESRAQVLPASRGYKDINRLGISLLRSGGLLATFSCSGHIGSDLFQKIVADAALDAGREARIVARLGQPADHPVSLAFPEGSYLKGLVCEIG